MDYFKLTLDNITSYLLSIEPIQTFLENGPLILQRLDDNRVNTVFQVQSETNPLKKLIVKQSPPFLEVNHKKIDLPAQRILFEYHALKNFYEHAPNHIPKVHYFDETKYVIITEFIDHVISLSEGIKEQILYPNFADQISDFLSINHFKNSSFFIDSAQKESLISTFKNNDLCHYTLMTLFDTDFLMRHSRYKREFYPSAQILASITQTLLLLKSIYTDRKESTLHGYLKRGSILLNQSNLYVIDTEYSFYGPVGYDLGVLIGSLLVDALYSYSVKKNLVYSHWLLSTLNELLKLYQTKFTLLYNAHIGNPSNTIQEQLTPLTDIEQISLGFAAIHMLDKVSRIEHSNNQIDAATSSDLTIFLLKTIGISRDILLNFPHQYSFEETYVNILHSYFPKLQTTLSE